MSVVSFLVVEVMTSVEPLLSPFVDSTCRFRPVFRSHSKDFEKNISYGSIAYVERTRKKANSVKHSLHWHSS